MEIDDALTRMYELGLKHALELCEHHGVDIAKREIEFRTPKKIEEAVAEIVLRQGRDERTRATVSFEETRSN